MQENLLQILYINILYYRILINLKNLEESLIHHLIKVVNKVDSHLNGQKLLVNNSIEVENQAKVKSKKRMMIFMEID